MNWMVKDVMVSVLPRKEVVKAIEGAGFEVVEKIDETYLPKGYWGSCSACCSDAVLGWRLCSMRSRCWRVCAVCYSVCWRLCRVGSIPWR